MSNIALGSKPFANKILEKCSGQQIQQLLNLVNNPGSATTIYLYGSQQLLNSSNIGITYVQLMIDPLTMRYLYGYLIYIDSTHCGFFSFVSETAPMIEIEIDPTTLSYEYRNEMLYSAEFRRSIIDLLVEAGKVEEYVTDDELAVALAGKADLVNGKVPESQLPSYVDDVLEYADLAHFPSEGEEGKIYVALDTGYTYRWSGSAYIQIGGQDLSNYLLKSDIVVNPALAGTEAMLTGLEVDDVKYKIPDASMNSLAPAYDNTATYAVNDLCSYQGKLYQCNTAVETAEAFDPNKWTETNVAALIVGAINANY